MLGLEVCSELLLWWCSLCGSFAGLCKKLPIKINGWNQSPALTALVGVLMDGPDFPHYC